MQYNKKVQLGSFKNRNNNFKNRFLVRTQRSIESIKRQPKKKQLEL